MITLYRAYDGETLLYIRQSADPAKRAKVHRRHSAWCTPDTRFVLGDTYTDRKDALAAETAAIAAEGPQHNITGARPSLDTSAEYRAAVQAAVNSAPPLTPQQQERLRRILADAPVAPELVIGGATR
jgi:hypothetical protein